MKLINSFLKIPEILNRELTPDEASSLIIKTFEEELGFDFVLIGYLSADGIELKNMSEPNPNIIFNDDYSVGIEFKNFIKNKKPLTLKIKKGEKNILTEIGISVKNNASAVILPLNIREAVFGIIIGINFSAKNISEETVAISQGLAGVFSYMVKDAELNNVFKLQLKILNDNVVEKTDSLNDIKAQNEKIREAEKIKTDFLMNMSHSLRTPLNAIIGLSEALEMKVFGELNKKQAEYILDIQNSGKEMLGLINDILDMSKIEAGAMRISKSHVDICLLIKEAVVIIKSLANKKKIKITTKLPKNPVIIPADAQKINQVLYNLLSNAVKFTNENGNIETGLKKLKNSVQIYVKDDGIGIDEKYYGKIFGKFEQVDNKFSGKYASTGLGLTITKELVELHNGKISVESKVNGGTTFIIDLPDN
ncbi:MAG: HAMP domain-containing histidine kinase [bacterium]|nr:HAMP domain-containing histidine kinase [bacterium]